MERNRTDEWHVKNMNLGLVPRDKVDISLTSDINKVMDLIIGDKELDYRIDGQYIYVTLREKKNLASTPIFIRTKISTFMLLRGLFPKTVHLPVLQCL